MSERLWSRLLSYGAAYELHFQKIVEPIIDTVFDPEQCESFSEELEFLMEVTNDQAFSDALLAIHAEAEVEKVINQKQMRFIISPT
ncbi:hypothetical protein [Microbulbifer thermotolerans]|uniref:hypothetical protein n=1 Tax=Microbulbifer thermotolerans TaxID=252514 RepID=UPI001C313B6A|nr:hypothetical protein [Microbulbifer thermotolerans]MCX2780592.1 hypothetical protein [Microbulbifer thermotolerans]MCX2806133.1 hypothetical protein [Microbulbifer thermotolerans]MCX2833026.1 hypothetical protein [Microbulbifer thermotolerans]MCX2835438.1 hypothetical protein [Microbulbifer thermotolerans]WKT60046.1 hypothetical protein Q2E61_14205 [Microbulbifer thermotolerans]